MLTLKARIVALMIKDAVPWNLLIISNAALDLLPYASSWKDVRTVCPSRYREHWTMPIGASI